MSVDKSEKLFEISLAIARRVLPFLGQRHIPATPENYMIFYLYFEGEMHLVRRVVDAQLNSGQPWTNQTTESVFGQLFSAEANIEFRRGNERLVQSLRQAADYIMIRSCQTAELADATSRSLCASIDDAPHIAEAGKISQWLRRVLADVQQINQASSELSGDLGRKSQELQKAVESLDRLETLALTDGLTALPNRRAWDSRLRVEFNRFQRYGRPSSVLLLDIDDFKSVNDRFGHLVGDQALMQVANLCQQMLRTVDFLARFGGEEFTCLLPETSLDGAYVVAERLRGSVASWPFVADGHKMRLTASLGVSCFRPDDQGPEQVLERADKSMYRAKALGKNLVCGENELGPAKACLS